MGDMVRKKKLKWPWLIGIPTVLLLGVAAYIVIMYIDFTKSFQKIYRPIDRDVSDKREHPIDLNKRDPFSVLVLGIDARKEHSGRSDTIIVLTMNPKTNSTKMISIPSDTYTEMVGQGFKDKLNQAYAFGGIEMTMESVEHLLDIPIDYIVHINMESFKDIVDAVGGVTINNTLAFKHEHYTLPKGTINLNGNEALAFVRMHYENPRGDFDHQDRQKQMIEAVLREGTSASSLFTYKSIFGAISNNIRTNMTADEMIDVQKNYRHAAENVEQLYFKNGSEQKINGVCYYTMNEAELAKIQGELKLHLDL